MKVNGCVGESAVGDADIEFLIGNRKTTTQFPIPQTLPQYKWVVGLWGSAVFPIE